ncbi:MAG: 5-bromo-4-chloroindolyl phosphate hydrolysis family protein [Clostridia bacterium]|nr:5-bromo-4-chloroindolyl phosphate hydrolysis family protein [Clostridia bacterium]
MNNPKDGKGFHFDFSKIPIPVIVLAYICYFPAGVILSVLRFFGPSAQNEKQNEDKTQQQEFLQNQKTTPRKAESDPKAENAAKKKKNRKAKHSVVAIVLYILAVMFVFAGVMQTLDGAKAAENILDFLRNILLNDSIVLYLLGLASYIGGSIFKNRTDRQNVLRSIIGNRNSIHLTRLSAISGTSVKKVRRDLQSMIDKGEFGEEAYIDMAKGVFMRFPDTEPDADPETKTAGFSVENEESAEKTENQNENFRAIILEIRRLNDEIKDYAVSERIYRIEEHTQNIFDYVTDHPEAMPQIRTFLNYYLPTTLKLLESYRRIEQVGVAGENMKKSKENIENILDMLVRGYEQQVDQLFRHESMDISSEISVLETMMKQDGLDGHMDFDFGSAAAQSMPEDKQ